MQNKVFVLNNDKKPLSPCHPAKARKLLDKGKAAVYRMYPFTIILQYEVVDPNPQPLTMKVDPGSRTTGLALVQDNESGSTVVWAAELQHRGLAIKEALLSRHQLRSGRRSRKTRYRKPRFNNRTRPEGWLAPSLQSRVDNIQNWFIKLFKFCPIYSISMESVRFDMQLMQNPEISGVEYQQGELAGYEVREYLLEKFNRVCVYCGIKDTAFEIEHIVPKSRGGSNQVSNLTIACRECNLAKGTQTAAEFGHSNIQAQAKRPLHDAAAVNSTRNAIRRMFESTGLVVETGTGGQTKFNRIKQGYPKSHWIDAACVGSSGRNVELDPDHQPLLIKATGRGSRQMCRVNKYGFPRTKAKSVKRVHGFQTGDMVKAIVTKGKKVGTYFGRVAVRKSGGFDIRTKTVLVSGVGWKYCQTVHRSDGYSYIF